jgi:hypothetical protein
MDPQDPNSPPQQPFPNARPAPPRPFGPGMGPMPAPAADIGQDAGIRMLIPVGRSIWAIAAGYLGLVSVLCVPAPFALITGIVAIYDIKAHPDRHGMGRAIFGIVMGAIGSIGFVFMLIGLIASLGKR